MDRDLLYLILSTVCFFGGFAFSVFALKSARGAQYKANLLVMGLGFVFQCLFLYERGQLAGRCPITSSFEVLIFLCWSMVGLYFLIGSAYRLSLLGMFTAPMAFAFQSIALLLDRTPGTKPDKVDPWLEMHASLSLLSYGAFALACVAGVMFLVQDHQLKNKKLNTLFYNLPPIHHLAKAVFRLSLLGFIVLTVGILSAFFMENFPSPIKLVLTIAVWLAYGTLSIWQLVRGMGEKRLAWSAICVFALPVLTLWVINAR